MQRGDGALAPGFVEALLQMGKAAEESAQETRPPLNVPSQLIRFLTSDLRGRTSVCNLDGSRTGRLRDLCIRTVDWALMRACMHWRVAAACLRTR